MTEESDLTVSVGPDAVVAPQVEAQTEGQAAESQTADPAPEGEGEEKKSRAAERRERYKAQQERLREEARAAQDKLAEIEARKAKIAKSAESDQQPTEAEFPDPLELATAVALWKHSRKAVSRDVAELEEQAAEVRKKQDNLTAAERQIIAQSWAESVETAKQRYADFERVAFTAPISDEVADLITTSEVGPDVAYWLGQNPRAAIEISRMPLADAARAIGRIEASLTAPAPRQITQAPAPIAPVRGKASAQVDPSKMSMEEYAKWARNR